jgi:hypothetical protein
MPAISVNDVAAQAVLVKEMQTSEFDVVGAGSNASAIQLLNERRFNKAARFNQSCVEAHDQRRLPQ